MGWAHYGNRPKAIQKEHHVTTLTLVGMPLRHRCEEERLKATASYGLEALWRRYGDTAAVGATMDGGVSSAPNEFES
ncbi:hypothetical protein E2542_SST16450 [Spatholobus suberectus]|nr:hypothetical protein E2542_SST16450 [Spatholobus suberectus]